MNSSAAKPADTGTGPNTRATSTAPFTQTIPPFVDPEALKDAATQPRLDGELLTSAELFEGDIIGIEADDISYYIAAKKIQPIRTNFADDSYFGTRTWPDNLVPCVLSTAFRPKDKQTIRHALQEFTAKSTVTFREKQDSDSHYVYMAPGFGCSSYVGRQGGRQLLVLQVPGCLNRGYIHHELMHTLGFYHEQSRTNRDEYVEINWENIPKAHHSSFLSYAGANSLNEERPYDIASLMHYGMFDFAIDKRVWTIRPRATKANTSEAAKMGQRQSLSTEDVERIQWAYPKGP